MRLRFLGANRQVTGSRYLLEAGGLRLLVDCGLFQERPFLGRNWEPFPVAPSSLDAVLLTHAHLDHCGLLPKLVQEGFRGPILATAASTDLGRIVLLDAAHLQEEDAAFKRKRHRREGRRGPYPEVPLYTVEDAEEVLPLFRRVSYGEPLRLNERVEVRFFDAGHIIGSAMLEVMVREKGVPWRLVFSGDIGQWGKPLLRDPSVFSQADVVVMESTYGDRNHEDPGQAEDLLAQVILETVERGGNLVIPVFAIERAQEVLFFLDRLLAQDRIPHLLVFLDSPMAAAVSRVFLEHPECLDEETLGLLQRGENPLSFVGLKVVETVEESKAINRIRGSCIIMAGSGMCTGGRIKHHLVHNISRPECTILFVGYQAQGTLGRQILDGHPEVRIHGQFHPVRARIAQIHGFSAHADQKALLLWLSHFQSPPRYLFLTHGDEEVSLRLAEKLRREGKWRVEVPEYGQEWEFE